MGDSGDSTATDEFENETPRLTTTSKQTIKMKHLAAYLLLGLGGNTSPSAADITAVLESVGIEADSDRLDKLISELKGKDINEVRRLCNMELKRCALY